MTTYPHEEAPTRLNPAASTRRAAAALRRRLTPSPDGAELIPADTPHEQVRALIVAAQDAHRTATGRLSSTAAESALAAERAHESVDAALRMRRRFRSPGVRLDWIQLKSRWAVDALDRTMTTGNAVVAGSAAVAVAVVFLWKLLGVHTDPDAFRDGVLDPVVAESVRTAARKALQIAVVVGSMAGLLFASMDNRYRGVAARLVVAATAFAAVTGVAYLAVVIYIAGLMQGIGP